MFTPAGYPAGLRSSYVWLYRFVATHTLPFSGYTRSFVTHGSTRLGSWFLPGYGYTDTRLHAHRLRSLYRLPFLLVTVAGYVPLRHHTLPTRLRGLLPRGLRYTPHVLVTYYRVLRVYAVVGSFHPYTAVTRYGCGYRSPAALPHGYHAYHVAVLRSHTCLPH